MNLLTMLAQDPNVEAIAGVVIAVAVVVALVILGVVIFVLWLLYGAQSRIPEQYRDISPGAIWLMLIPLFNLVWMFFVFQRIPTSYQKYFASQGRSDVGDCGKNLGLSFCICYLCAAIPVVGIFALLGALVVLILFLVKIMGLKKQIHIDGGAPPAAVPPAGGPPVV